MRAKAYEPGDATQRTDGRYRIHARAFLAQMGLKQIIRTETCYGQTKKEAAAAANQFVANARSEYLDTAKIPEKCTDTLAVYGRKWLKDVCKDRVKRSTWDGYSELFRTYVEEPDAAMPLLGKIAMKEVQPLHVLALYRYLNTSTNAREKKSSGRARALHAVLRQIFKNALTNGVIKEPLDLKLRGAFPRRKHRRPEAYTVEQLAAFLRAADEDRYRAFWYLFAMTGARPGELLALTRDDVDLDGLKITISKRLRIIPSRVRVAQEERWEIDDPKTPDSIREVLFPQELVPILQQHVGTGSAKAKARKRWGNRYGDLLFTTQGGLPVDWTNMRASYQRICARAKIEHPLKPYALRHSFATQQLDDGVPIELISEILGHADGGALARRTYVASRTSRQKPAAAAAGKRLRALTGTAG
jgi:integrase